MTNVCFQMVVFNSDHFLPAVLDAIKPFGPIVATEGPVQYWQRRGYTTSTDRTNEILEQYGIPTVHGQFSEKTEMMQAAEHLIPEGTTHVWMVDADEVWSAAALLRTLTQLEQYDSVAFKPITFYGGFEDYLTGFELRAMWVRIQRWCKGAHWQEHRPPTVLTAEGLSMRSLRHLDSPEQFHHYSYVFPQQVARKVEYYASWGAGVIPNYYRDVYLPWVRGPRAVKYDIERRYHGVHEWLPQRRGDCFTEWFQGQHPLSIVERLTEYSQRFSKELRETVEHPQYEVGAA